MLKGKQSILFDNAPYILSSGSVVGKKEFEGPLGHEFDAHDDDSRFGEESYEKAESLLQKIALETAMRKANVNENDIKMIFAGDLLNRGPLTSRKSSLPSFISACSHSLL